MKQEFYGIYEDLSTLIESNASELSRVRLLLHPRQGKLLRSQFARYGARWVHESIDDAVAELGLQNRLRPDAKHFLLTNFYEMIVLPLSHPDNPLPIPEEQLRNAISRDVRTLLTKSMEQRPGEQITGTDILKVAAEVSDSLEINGFRFWGAKEHAE